MALLPGSRLAHPPGQADRSCPQQQGCSIHSWSCASSCRSATAVSALDPYLRPQTSLRNRFARALWGFCYALLFRPSPRPLHAWRAMLLRRFGAKLGRNCHIYPGSRIWAPWNLTCGDVVAIADGAEIYNPWPVTIGSHATISQQAYVCTASHDMDDPAFPMTGAPVRIGDHVWICARASVLPGVTLESGAVLALGSVATRPLTRWTLHAGSPARPVRERRNHE
jgi:putative colanic acid biosynthesis acetyltransferase WcaF